MITQTEGNYLSNLGGGGSDTEAGARINEYEMYVQQLSFAVEVITIACILHALGQSHLKSASASGYFQSRPTEG